MDVLRLCDEIWCIFGEKCVCIYHMCIYIYVCVCNEIFKPRRFECLSHTWLPTSAGRLPHEPRATVKLRHTQPAPCIYNIS
jgi:hypothetical protein